MRSNNEYRHILRLWESGCNKSQITRKTGIPRGTVCDCIRKYGTLRGLEEYLHGEQEKHWTVRKQGQKFRVNYAYMLGIYLGDGYIATHPRTYRFRVSLDKKYPDIINRVMNSMQALVPDNKIQTVDRIGCIEVGSYCNDWIEMFPQHGKGVKHERDIVLEDWQEEIVDENLIEFVRGLIHSDGSRFEPVVNGTIYPRYQFTNVSGEIRGLFCNTVEKLGLNWTHWGINITIARRPDVSFLDEYIGAKS